MDDLPEMLTPGELARLLHVDAKTVSRWCRMGRLTAVITPGGHRRIPLPAVLDLLRGMGFDDESANAAVRRVTSVKWRPVFFRGRSAVLVRYAATQSRISSKWV